MQSSSTWSSMVSGPEDDFSNFLEFGDLQFNFPPFDSNNQNGEEIQDGGGGHPALGMQTSNNAGGVIDFQHGDMPHFTHPSGLADFDTSSNVFPDLDMPMHLLEQQQQHAQMPQPIPYGHPYRGQNIIPHTPNSIEMHGGHPQFQQAACSNHARAVYDHYRQHSRGQTTFTPLVSPAVTPHDAQLRYHEHMVPNEDFSPLISPALKAQNNASQRSVYGALRGSDTSDTTSPIDVNIDPSLQTPAPSAARKGRRRTSNAAQRAPSRSVRQSPAMKPQPKKKHSSKTSIPSNKVSGIVEDAENARRSTNAMQHTGGMLSVGIGHESSEAESISPEPLSEILMPPPSTPKSASASKSPQIVAKPGFQSAPMPLMSDKPATPASLMKIRKAVGRPAGSALKEQTSLLESELEQTMEAIALPDPAKGGGKRPALTPLRTSDANEDEMTPTMSARKTPKIAPTSAPVTATGSAFPSPMSPTAAQPHKRGDSRLSGRGAVVSAETSALLLASKSNYQNLLEGTHLPGVSYPETLSTNLTSKRTSHKIAEQGRRNRINTALQEIASLLPPTTPNGPNTPKDAPVMPNGNGNGKMMTMGSSPGATGATTSVMMTTGTAAQQSSSKASTVELAIDYIKALQGELRDVKAKLEVAEKQLATTGEEVGPCNEARSVMAGTDDDDNDDDDGGGGGGGDGDG
ncbi:MAG: hypothetical protein L6R39_001847 [Caloplaca ligustica]|nr:MAG: hypothetical protein L6R39_001847 [Caloplaca ligustica]